MHIELLNFDPQPFLDGIKERRPNVTDPSVASALDSGESFLRSWLKIFPPVLPLAWVPAEALEYLSQITESLRCCGVAPDGWPAPPAEDAVLVARYKRIGGPSHEAN